MLLAHILQIGEGTVLLLAHCIRRNCFICLEKSEEKSQRANARVERQQ